MSKKILELNACPKCSNTPFIYDHHNGGFYLECTCGNHSDTFKSQEEVVLDWNSKNINSVKTTFIIEYCQEENTSGLKYDQGKLRYDLIPFNVLDEIAKVYTAGAAKYGDNQWQSLDEFKKRYEGALLRHFSSYKKGEMKDEETDCYHLAQVAWNAFALLWKVLQEDQKPAP